MAAFNNRPKVIASKLPNFTRDPRAAVGKPDFSIEYQGSLATALFFQLVGKKGSQTPQICDFCHYWYAMKLLSS
jgi:hypothetical protein